MNRKRRFLTYATLACMISTAPCFGGGQKQCRRPKMDGSGPCQDGRGPRCNRQCNQNTPCMNGSCPYRDGRGPGCNQGNRNQNTPRMDGSGPYRDGQGRGRLIRGTCLRDNR